MLNCFCPQNRRHSAMGPLDRLRAPEFRRPDDAFTDLRLALDNNFIAHRQKCPALGSQRERFEPFSPDPIPFTAQHKHNIPQKE